MIDVPKLHLTISTISRDNHYSIGGVVPVIPLKCRTNSSILYALGQERDLFIILSYVHCSTIKGSQQLFLIIVHQICLQEKSKYLYFGFFCNIYVFFRSTPSPKKSTSIMKLEKLSVLYVPLLYFQTCIYINVDLDLVLLTPLKLLLLLKRDLGADLLLAVRMKSQSKCLSICYNTPY